MSSSKDKTIEYQAFKDIVVTVHLDDKESEALYLYTTISDLMSVEGLFFSPEDVMGLAEALNKASATMSHYRKTGSFVEMLPVE